MKKTIGIVGGIGPYAGLDIVEKIFDNTVAVADKDHVPVILHSVPELIPDRTEYILGKSSQNPSIGIIESIKNLNNAGANVISIACNAAHSPQIYLEIKKGVENLDLSLVSIIDVTVGFIKKQKSIDKVAVLSITGTNKSRVYHNAFNANDIDVIEIDDIVQEKLHDSIWNSEYGIKAFSNPIKNEARESILEIISLCITKGAKAIILGCTELPLAIKENFINSVPIIDASNLLARALIKIVNPKKLKET
ncbi:aspartate/glutamate racemase family protein [Bacteroidota bacterium]